MKILYQILKWTMCSSDKRDSRNQALTEITSTSIESLFVVKINLYPLDIISSCIILMEIKENYLLKIYLLYKMEFMWYCFICEKLLDLCDYL
jgi:hypothetical protein